MKNCQPRGTDIAISVSQFRNDKIAAVFNRLKGGDREKAPEIRRCSGDGSRSEGYDRLSGESRPTATA
jgi:hypothetical protein